MTGERVRFRWASQCLGMVGTVLDNPPLHSGMDVVVEFDNGWLAEYRHWELEPEHAVLSTDNGER